jgi:hypothetical protein
VRDHRAQIVQQRAILCDMVFQDGNLSFGSLKPVNFFVQRVGRAPVMPLLSARTRYAVPFTSNCSLNRRRARWC